MQLQRVLVQEHPVEAAAQLGGQQLDRGVPDQVVVDLRADRQQPLGQDERPLRGRPGVEVLGVDRGEEVRDQRQIHPGAGAEVRTHDGGLDARVDHHRDHGVLEARHEHQVVDEGVLRPAQAAQVAAQPVGIRGGQIGHHQHLEGGPFLAGGRHGLRAAVVVALADQDTAGRDGPVADQAAADRLGDPTDLAVGAVGQVAQLGHQPAAGKGVVVLQRLHVRPARVQRGGQVGPGGLAERRYGQPARGVGDRPPQVHPQLPHAVVGGQPLPTGRALVVAVGAALAGGGLGGHRRLPRLPVVRHISDVRRSSP